MNDTSPSTTWTSLDETRHTVWILFDLGAVRYVNEIVPYLCPYATDALYCPMNLHIFARL